MDAVALTDFDYPLQPERIAVNPSSPRDASRLMVVPPGPHDALVHAHMHQLPKLLRKGDVLLVNTSKVVPARLTLRRASGAVIDAVLMAPEPVQIATAQRWQALVRNAQSVREGELLYTPNNTPLAFARGENKMAWLSAHMPMLEVLLAEGAMPLPPYIVQRRKQLSAQQTTSPSSHAQAASDADDYQSMFARQLGAVAAPTASLHFTESLVQALREADIEMLPVCLHVGAGTFLPVPQEHEHDVRKHTMHQEHYEVPPATADGIARALAAGRRVVPVGTTCLRAVETWARTGSTIGTTDLFVLPGDRFAVAGAMVTNFHAPRSTLMMLVSAMSGRERILDAYAQAAQLGYRFLSYGDAMLLEATQPPTGLLAAAREA